jgi:hypothetical protein
MNSNSPHTNSGVWIYIKIIVISILLLICGYILGIQVTSSYSYNNSLESNIKNPLVFSFEVTRNAFKHHDSISKDVLSPNQRIFLSDLEIDNKELTIKKDNLQLARFSDTKSMDPVIDSNTIGLEIVPKSKNEIKKGDIVSYYSIKENITIIHRVMKTGYDKDGWYAIFKGDNNPTIDEEKVRFNQIRRILVGILY